MAEEIRKAAAKDGREYEFVMTDPPLLQGAMKVYFSPCRDYVIGFFKAPLSPRERISLESVSEKFRQAISGQIGGNSLKELFCGPENIVEWNGETGIVVPMYAGHFFFRNDPKLKGKAKEGKWFASAKLFQGMDKRETGSFRNFLLIAKKLACAVGCLGKVGLVHADLSSRNILVDPCSAGICLLATDTLEIPGVYSSGIAGTPGFTAPEIFCDKTGRNTPETMNHSLAVLIYMLLLHRHPLRGGRFFGPDVDSDEEEKLLMSKDPLYIEHPTDHRNRNMKREYGNDFEICRPWVDLDNFSAAKIAGPHLAALFEKAFIPGLKDPAVRPGPAEWVQAIDLTLEKLHPCKNPECIGKAFFADAACSGVCPFCGTEKQ